MANVTRKVAGRTQTRSARATRTAGAGGNVLSMVRNIRGVRASDSIWLEYTLHGDSYSIELPKNFKRDDFDRITGFLEKLVQGQSKAAA